MSYQKMMGILDESADAVMGDAETDADPRASGPISG